MRRNEPEFKSRWEERQKEHSESYTTVTYKRRVKKRGQKRAVSKTFTKRKYFTGTLNACLWAACPLCAGDYDDRFVDELQREQQEDAEVLAQRGDGPLATGYRPDDLVDLWVLELARELLFQRARDRSPQEREELRAQATKDTRKILRSLD